MKSRLKAKRKDKIKSNLKNGKQVFMYYKLLNIFTQLLQEIGYWKLKSLKNFSLIVLYTCEKPGIVSVKSQSLTSLIANFLTVIRNLRLDLEPQLVTTALQPGQISLSTNVHPWYAWNEWLCDGRCLPGKIVMLGNVLYVGRGWEMGVDIGPSSW